MAARHTGVDDDFEDGHMEIHEEVGEYMEGSPLIPTTKFVRIGRVPPKRLPGSDLDRFGRRRHTSPGATCAVVQDFQSGAVAIEEDVAELNTRVGEAEILQSAQERRLRLANRDLLSPRSDRASPTEDDYRDVYGIMPQSPLITPENPGRLRINHNGSEPRGLPSPRARDELKSVSTAVSAGNNNSRSLPITSSQNASRTSPVTSGAVLTRIPAPAHRGAAIGTSPSEDSTGKDSVGTLPPLNTKGIGKTSPVPVFEETGRQRSTDFIRESEQAATREAAARRASATSQPMLPTVPNAKPGAAAVPRSLSMGAGPRRVGAVPAKTVHEVPASTENTHQQSKATSSKQPLSRKRTAAGPSSTADDESKSTAAPASRSHRPTLTDYNDGGYSLPTPSFLRFTGSGRLKHADGQTSGQPSSRVSPSHTTPPRGSNTESAKAAGDGVSMLNGHKPLSARDSYRNRPVAPDIPDSITASNSASARNANGATKPSPSPAVKSNRPSVSNPSAPSQAAEKQALAAGKNSIAKATPQPTATEPAKQKTSSRLPPNARRKVAGDADKASSPADTAKPSTRATTGNTTERSSQSKPTTTTATPVEHQPQPPPPTKASSGAPPRNPQSITEHKPTAVRAAPVAQESEKNTTSPSRPRPKPHPGRQPTQQIDVVGPSSGSDSGDAAVSLQEGAAAPTVEEESSSKPLGRRESKPGAKHARPKPTARTRVADVVEI